MEDTKSSAVYEVDEVAAMLRLDRKTVYNAIKAGEIPAIRVRRRLLVPRAAIERMLGAAP